MLPTTERLYQSVQSIYFSLVFLWYFSQSHDFGCSVLQTSAFVLRLNTTQSCSRTRQFFHWELIGFFSLFRTDWVLLSRCRSQWAHIHAVCVDRVAGILGYKVGWPLALSRIGSLCAVGWIWLPLLSVLCID